MGKWWDDYMGPNEIADLIYEENELKNKDKERVDPYRVNDLMKTFMKGVEEDPNGIKPHDPGAKLDSGKIKAGVLLDFGRALMAVGEVGTHGVNKYSRGGSQHVPNGIERYTDALLRHLLSECSEELDRDSNLLHASHAAWNALSRLELLLRDKEAKNENHNSVDNITGDIINK